MIRSALRSSENLAMTLALPLVVSARTEVGRHVPRCHARRRSEHRIEQVVFTKNGEPAPVSHDDRLKGARTKLCSISRSIQDIGYHDPGLPQLLVPMAGHPRNWVASLMADRAW